MKIGVYLPTLLAGVGPRAARGWARRAEQLGFDALAISSDGADEPYEPLLAVATAAAVTERIALIGDLTYGPMWTAATHVGHTVGLDRASGGRFTMALTFARDPVAACGVDSTGTVRILDAQLAELRRIQQAGAAAPCPLARSPLLVGGCADLAAGRIARHGDGWLMRAGTPEEFSTGVAVVRAAWADARRPGRPSATAVVHYALGDTALQAAEVMHRGYHATYGATFAAAVIAGSATNLEQLRDRIATFAAAGADRVLAVPAVPDLTQLEGLAAVRPPTVHV
jgi:alkanesulfonate monooxygenase SsuD/methylene tetrahydromethanopterin reductase-like flavin-dependent oxidoreductase (luciferase family)